MRIHPLLSGFGAMLVAIAPVHAWAQQPPASSVAVRDRPHSEYDPLGMRFGGFMLNASLDLAVTSTDNLFAAAESDAVDDVIYSEAPFARLASDWSRHSLIVEGGATLTQHQDFSGEDANSGYVRAAGRLDVGRASSVNALVRLAHQVTPRTDPDSPLVGAPVEYDRIDTSIGATHRFARFLVAVDGGRSTYRYDGAQSFRDNDENQFHARLDAELSPRFGFALQANVDNRDYFNTASLSSEAHSYLAGLTINTDLMRGELSVGHFERQFHGSTISTLDGIAVAGNVQWYITQLTTLTFTGRRDANAEISATVGLPYITTEFAGRVDHELLRNVILSAEYRRGKREYHTIDRSDEFSQFNVGADYLLNRRVALRLRYDHYQDDSSGVAAGHDYDANAATVGVSLRL